MLTRVLESLDNAFGRAVTPLQLPIGSEKSLSGVVDLVRMKAYTYEMGGNGKGKEGPIPANMADAAKEAHEKLVELVAEGKDSLMEEFFETGTIPEEHLVPALHEAIREDKLFPVLFTSGLGNIGVDELMDFIVDYTPAASEHHAITGWTAEGAEPSTRKGTDNEPASVYVFKTCRTRLRGAFLISKFFLAC
jgi:elongation factor G